MRSETLFKHDLRTRILIFLYSVTLETAGGKIRIWLNFSKGKILVPVCNLISAQLTLVRPNYINALAETVIATDITVSLLMFILKLFGTCSFIDIQLLSFRHWNELCRACVFPYSSSQWPQWFQRCLISFFKSPLVCLCILSNSA